MTWLLTLLGSVILPDFLSWIKDMPVVGLLVVLMLIDIASGLFLAISKGTLNSTISLRGMSCKALILLTVSAGGVVQAYITTTAPLLAQQLPVMNLISWFYVITELISILENASAAGVPLPNGLIQILLKMRDQKATLLVQKGITTNTQINVFDAPSTLSDTQKLVIHTTTTPKT